MACAANNGEPFSVFGNIQPQIARCPVDISRIRLLNQGDKLPFHPNAATVALWIGNIASSPSTGAADRSAPRAFQTIGMTIQPRRVNSQAHGTTQNFRPFGASSICSPIERTLPVVLYAFACYPKSKSRSDCGPMRYLSKPPK